VAVILRAGRGGGVYHGHDALQRYVRDLDEAFEVIRPEATQLLEVGDLVVGVGRVCYRGQASGVETEDTSVGWVFRFKNEKVVSFRAFREPEKAFAAVGLEAEARPA
jgi:ketosteroid isomerase-like protein